MSINKYILWTLGTVICGELAIICLRKLCRLLRKTSKNMNANGRKEVYFRVIFFPDQGIVRYEHSSYGSVNNSPSTESPNPETPKNESVPTSKKKMYLHKVKTNPFFHPEMEASVNPNGHSWNLRMSLSLIHIINVIDSAKMSLIVCVHSFTCKDLIDAVIRAKGRRVAVRVLVDSSMYSESCQKTVETLQQHNVPVRTSHPPLMMHHKFAVVDSAAAVPTHRDLQPRACGGGRNIDVPHRPTRDEEAGDSGVLMMGSFNWTWSAVVGNNENVIITNQPLLISCFMEEFEALWGVCQQQGGGRRQIYEDVKDNDASSTIYYQALFFPDQGILKHDSRTTNFGSVNNLRFPGDQPCVNITKEDHIQSFFRHEIKSSAFFTPLPQYADPPEEVTEPLHCSNNLKISTSLVRMIQVLDSVQVSLAVCLHTFTIRELINAVIRAQIRGVKVRVLLDSGMCRDSCQKTVETLRKHSIPVRPSYSALMMHHKFAIIDAPIYTQMGNSNGLDEQTHIPSERLLDLWTNFHVSKFVEFWKKVSDKCKEEVPPPPLPPTGVVMTGSYNWTWSGVVSNHEDVLITNQPTLVQHFSKEFESLWDKS